jgi:hypothetical protein
MEDERIEKKEQKLYVNELTESLQLSSLIFAPIFMPRRNGYKLKNENENEKEFESVTFKRTENETITYTGDHLDIATDFPLFSILVSHVQMQQKTHISLSEAELFKALKKQRRTSAIADLEARLEKLRDCKIHIQYMDDAGKTIRHIKTQLVLESDWDQKSKKINLGMSEHFMSLDLKYNDKEKIDLSIYNKIKSGYGKTLFLYLETKKFKNQVSVKIKTEDLISRFAANIKTNKEKNRELKKALNELRESHYIMDFAFFKSKIQHIPMVNIFRLH